MAYLNEFPKWDSNGRNLDWLLEQYSTFEKRLQEIRDEFTETVTRLEGDIDSLENTYQRELDLFEGRINTLVREITRKVDSINENIGGYVNEYLTTNINTILQDNPILDTIYQKVGVVEPNSSIAISDLTSDIIDVVILDNSLNHARYFANSTQYNLVSVTQNYTEVIIEEQALSVATLPQFTTRLMLSNVNNSLVINNVGNSNLTVYKKRFN